VCAHGTVLSAQTKMEKGSLAPATTISPDGSTAKLVNCTGSGDANVRKFLYLHTHTHKNAAA